MFYVFMFYVDFEFWDCSNIMEQCYFVISDPFRGHTKTESGKRRMVVRKESMITIASTDGATKEQNEGK